MSERQSFHVSVVTPEGAEFKQVAVFSKCPGTVGVIGVEPNHTPTLATLKPGEFSLRDTKGNTQSFFVSSGLVQITEDTLTLLVPFLEKVAAIDKGRAEAARDRAIARLAQDKANAAVNLKRAKLALDRAEARIALHLKHKGV